MDEMKYMLACFVVFNELIFASGIVNCHNLEAIYQQETNRRNNLLQFEVKFIFANCEL